jgi:hypothetical protein
MLRVIPPLFKAYVYGELIESFNNNNMENNFKMMEKND